MICYENIVDVTILYNLSFDLLCVGISFFYSIIYFFIFLFIRILLYPNLNICVMETQLPPFWLLKSLLNRMPILKFDPKNKLTWPPNILGLLKAK